MLTSSFSPRLVRHHVLVLQLAGDDSERNENSAILVSRLCLVFLIIFLLQLLLSLRAHKEIQSALMAAKFSMLWSKSNFPATEFSIDKMAKFDSRSCDIRTAESSLFLRRVV